MPHVHEQSSYPLALTVDSLAYGGKHYVVVFLLGVFQLVDYNTAIAL